MPVHMEAFDENGNKFAEWDRDDDGNLIEPSQIEKMAKDCEIRSRHWFPHIYDPDNSVMPVPVYMAMAAGGEMGEAQNFVKKIYRDANPDLIPMVGFEIVDTLIYLLLLARSLGINVENAYREKVQVLVDRWGTVPGLDQ